MSRHSFAMAAVSNKEGRSQKSVPAAVEPEAGFTIGDLAHDFGVTLRTLRFYESRGLLSPTRSGMARIYTARDRARLALIIKGKQLGFTLIEIRAMLAHEDDKTGGDKAAAGTAIVGGLQLSREQIAEQLDLLRGQRKEIDEAITELEATQARL